MKVFNICDTPLAFYFQRQSELVNRHLGGRGWRYYYDVHRWPGSEHFVDLSVYSSRDEVMAILKESDAYIFHATRNYRRTLYCRDGLIKSTDYPGGKKEFVLIHGHPETKRTGAARDFINRHRKNVAFFVSTPDQLEVFPGTALYPIFGQIDPSAPLYRPRDDYDKCTEAVRIIRRSNWKAEGLLLCLAYELGLSGRGRRFSINAKNAARRFVGKPELFPYIGEGVYEGPQGTLDNLYGPQDFRELLEDIRRSDVLLENQWGDFPGGGTCNLIGFEAMSMGLAVVNGISRNNAEILASWLEADESLPLPLWENARDYAHRHASYMKRLVFDASFRNDIKRRSRAFCEKWLDKSRVAPRLLKQLENA